MSMNGFFIAIPEDRFEEFCQTQYPLRLDYVSRWDVADAWDVIRVVSRMGNHVSSTLVDGVDLNVDLSADCRYLMFKPEQVQSYFEYLEEMDQLGKIERFRHEPVRIAYKLYHGESIGGDQLADYLLGLKEQFKHFAPVYDADSNVSRNRHVVLFFAA